MEPATTLASLIASSAEAEILSKAVFSKPHDKAVSRVTLTLKRVKGETVLQLETLRVADVADTQVNGKSFMEMFCLNFTHPLFAMAECGEEQLLQLMKLMQNFLA